MFIDLICFLRWAMWPMGLLLKKKSKGDAVVGITSERIKECQWGGIVLPDRKIKCEFGPGLTLFLQSNFFYNTKRSNT